MTLPISFLKGFTDSFNETTQDGGSSYAEIIPANPQRKHGVLMQMTKGTADVMRFQPADSQPGASSGGFLLKGAYTDALGGMDGFVFVPTRKAIWARDHVGSSTDQTVIYMEV